MTVSIHVAGSPAAARTEPMPKIILSYRRNDAAAIAGRIYDRLASHYGKQSVFMDIDSIPFGVDFREHIADAIVGSDLLVAIIGPGWFGLDGQGAARIEDETDTACLDPSLKGVAKVETDGGHHFDGNYTAIAQRFIDRL